MNAVIKTYTLSECLDSLVSYVSAYERTGARNLVFCEDRLTLVTERAIVNALGGSFQTSVTTFARYLKTDGKLLAKQGSVMAIGSIMVRLQRENALKCFKSETGVATDAKCIYETIAQFAASRVTADTLKENSAELKEEMLKDKIDDLALIYGEYEEFLRENGYIDESRYLSLLPDLMRRDESLKNTNVFFLCFTSFTAQACETVRSAIESAANVIGIFCGGEEEFYTQAAANAFERVAAEYGKVQVRNAGQPIGGEAEALRQGLFSPERLCKELYPSVKTDKVVLLEAEDRNAEAEGVAVRIREMLAKEKNFRYRDIAVLLPDTAAYSLPVKKAFNEYGIPYFFDEKKSLKGHPLSRFLLSALEVVKEGCAPSSVQALAGNLFFGESGEYRNYLLKYANYRGGAKKPVKEVEGFDLAKVQSGRDRLQIILENIKRRGQGRVYCRSIRKIMKEFDVKNTLSTLAERVDDTAVKGYLSQIWNAVDRVLAEAESLLSDREMTAGEFSAVLADGLDATEISLIPLKTDAVFVGDIVDSRIEKVRALFALGMTDDVPRSGKDTALISDKDIAKLAEVKTLLEPTVAEVNLRNRENMCLNLCTFTERLFLSYPLGADGEEPALGEVFRYVRGIFATPTGGPLLPEKSGGAFVYQCSAPAPAIKQLLIQKSRFENGEEDSREKYSSLYDALVKADVGEGKDLLTLGKSVTEISDGKKLFAADGKVSPTLLEGYFSCPYHNFVAKGLRLKDREEAVVMAFDSGNFIHELLEKVSLKTEAVASEAEFRALAQQIGEDIAKKATYAAQKETKSGEYASKRLLAEGVEAAAAVYRQIKNSAFQVDEVEKTVSTADFYGKIDRVDTSEKYVRVVDYKTGNIDDSAGSYYTGRKLQMQLYMSAVKNDRIPAGVFYFPASVKYAETDEGRFRMKGFMNGDEEALLCGDKNLTADKKSEYFPAALKNGGNVRRVMAGDEFCDFLDYAVYVARQGQKEMEDGYIEPSPYDGSCGYCKYGGMCGFNHDLSATRNEGEVYPSEIVRIVRELKEGGEK